MYDDTWLTHAPCAAISRGCSRAPAVTSRGRAYNKYNGAVCSQHTVNIMRVGTTINFESSLVNHFYQKIINHKYSQPYMSVELQIVTVLVC